MFLLAVYSLKILVFQIIPYAFMFSLYCRMYNLFNNNECQFTSSKQSGAVIFRVGDHDLTPIAIPRRSQCISHSSYFEPLCKSIQHHTRCFPMLHFSWIIPVDARCFSFSLLIKWPKRLPGFYFSIYK